MKITRRQLRRLIQEIRIKPSIPNIPSGDAYTKIDSLARGNTTKASADVLANTFGFPGDSSYSSELKTYDDVSKIQGTEYAKDIMVQDVIDVYDEEVYNFTLDKIIYNEMNSVSVDEFDGFLKRLARAAFQHVHLNHGTPFTSTTTTTPMSSGEGVYRIYQALKKGSELI